MQACQKNTVRTEWAVGSTLHRGFYCPSPVYDLLVGNVKRGVIRKNGIPVENRSHVYGFDEAGRLLWCKSLYNAKAAYTEYLTYCDSRIFGVTVSEQGEVMSLTEEVYAEGRIVSYLYGLCLNPEGTVKIVRLISMGSLPTGSDFPQRMESALSSASSTQDFETIATSLDT